MYVVLLYISNDLIVIVNTYCNELLIPQFNFKLSIAGMRAAFFTTYLTY